MPTFPLLIKHAELDAHMAQQMLQIARDTGDAPIVDKVLSRLGDERQLRGIPALARGVGGAIAGSRPGTNLE